MFAHARSRSEPITISLNVAQLVEDEDHLPGVLVSYDEAVFDARDDDVAEELASRYSVAYLAYAQVFAAAIDAEAEKHPGLSGLVALNVDASITGRSAQGDRRVHNPTEWDSDTLVWHLWSAARQSAGLPEAEARRSSV